MRRRLLVEPIRHHVENAKKVESDRSFPGIGKIERLDPALDKLIAPDAKIEKLAEGYEWARPQRGRVGHRRPPHLRQEPGRGPRVAVWFGRDGGYVLYSDVVKNTVHRWDLKAGKASPFLSPSGYTGSTPRGGEPRSFPASATGLTR